MRFGPLRVGRKRDMRKRNESGRNFVILLEREMEGQRGSRNLAAPTGDDEFATLDCVCLAARRNGWSARSSLISHSNLGAHRRFN
jgi:hypothetical protein